MNDGDDDNCNVDAENEYGSYGSSMAEERQGIGHSNV